MVELMVTIAIMALMTGAVFVNLAGNRKTKGVETEARKLVAAIREAQSNSLTGKTPADGTVPCGWGIYYNPGSAPGEYRVYYNETNHADGCAFVNNPANPGTGPDRQFIPSGTTTNLTWSVPQVVALGNNVRFDAVSPDVVYFTIPHGRIFDESGAPIGGATLKFLLRSDDGTVFHTICIFSSGRVDDRAGNVSDCTTI